MNYNTKYSVLDKETNKEVFQNWNTSCFVEFTNASFDDDKKGYKAGRKVEVYLNTKNEANYSPDVESYSHLMEWWPEQLTKAGFPVTMEIRKDFERKYTGENKPSIYPNNEPRYIIKKGDYYIFTLDCDDYDSKAKLKMALYMIRYLYEYNQWEVLKAAYDYCQKQKKAPGFDVFFFMMNFIHYNGHTLALPHPQYVITSPSKIRMKELFNKWVNTKYDNNELTHFKSLLIQMENTVYNYNTGKYEKINENIKPIKKDSSIIKQDMKWTTFIKYLKDNGYE